MHAATRRRIAVPAALTSGLLLSGLLVWHTSYAAFTSSTGNTANTFASGSVTIGDNDGGTSLFTATALKPGSTDTNCITVNYTGSLPSTVHLSAAYTSAAAGANDLAPYLTFKIEDVSTTGTCAAATANSEIAASSTNLQTKVAALTAPGATIGWNSAANGDSKRYRFTYTLQDVDAAQNKTAGVGFTWTASSN
ncbi:hypothetical protein [Kineosporia sp. NBRC 101731]|uniref:hypothetical protein n=1 Tax=Kineosporia sp. NBRC 101731 TaxID=3032199 RepID=UPI0024A1176C|nr:hypothetical protein [Kineosporia sp. NBRC 101731]GLY33809.1 hypothetical protein Kisp02_71740 [Kineosporia sp. NBRC 101731]